MTAFNATSAMAKFQGLPVRAVRTLANGDVESQAGTVSGSFQVGGAIGGAQIGPKIKFEDGEYQDVPVEFVEFVDRSIDWLSMEDDGAAVIAAAKQGLREKLNVDALSDEPRVEEIAAKFGVSSGDMADMMEKIEQGN